MKTHNIPIEEIRLSTNIRKDLGELDDLAQSIESNGLLQPLIIDKEKNLIAGYRRFHALKKLGWTEAPCSVLENGQNKVVVQLIENYHRKDLSKVELVYTVRSLRDDYFNDLPWEQFGKMLGLSGRKVMIVYRHQLIIDAVGEKIYESLPVVVSDCLVKKYSENDIDKKDTVKLVDIYIQTKPSVLKFERMIVYNYVKDKYKANSKDYDKTRKARQTYVAGQQTHERYKLQHEESTNTFSIMTDDFGCILKLLFVSKNRYDQIKKLLEVHGGVII